MKKLLIITFGVSFISILIDQLTKIYIHSNFMLGESVEVIPNFFHITFVKNPGAAFGILAASNGFLRTAMLLVLPSLVIIFIFIYIIRNCNRKYDEAVAYSLILGGAISNLADRFRLGFVVDFLDFHYNRLYTWPAFNIADSSIFIGASILILYSLFEIKSTKSISCHMNKNDNF